MSLVERKRFLDLCVRRVLLDMTGTPAPFLRAYIVSFLVDAYWAERAIKHIEAGLANGVLAFDTDDALLQRQGPVTAERPIPWRHCFANERMYEYVFGASLGTCSLALEEVMKQREFAGNMPLAYQALIAARVYMVHFEWEGRLDEPSGIRIPGLGDLASHISISDPTHAIAEAHLEIGVLRAADFTYNETTGTWTTAAFRPPYSPIPCVALQYVEIRVVTSIPNPPANAPTVTALFHMLGNDVRRRIAKKPWTLRMPSKNEHVSGGMVRNTG